MGCVRGHAEPYAWYHHYHVPHPRRGGFRTRPYETHIHETRIYETRIHGTRIHAARIHGTRPYGTTICTQGRMCIFGEIVNGVMHLNEAGHIVAWTWQDLPNHVPNGLWDAFVVMPNPMHGIIIITCRTPATKSYGLPEIVRQLTRAPLSLSSPASKRPKPTKSKPINKGYDKQGR
jgi:hypothetical protein